MRFKTKEGEEVYFNEKGDVTAKYDIINWQPKEDGSVEFVTVGLYDASLPADRQLTINNSSLVWTQNAKLVRIIECQIHAMCCRLSSVTVHRVVDCVTMFSNVNQQCFFKCFITGACVSVQ